MKSLSSFLVAKSVDGRFVKVSDSGKLFSAGATLSLYDGQKFGMTELDHENCCKAAQFLLVETAAQSVDLEGGWRVSLF